LAKEKAGPTSSGALHRNNFTAAWARCRPDFTSREKKIEASQLLKGKSEHFFKVLSVLSLGLMYSLMTFLLRMPL
jgi:hypothetical protein